MSQFEQCCMSVTSLYTGDQLAVRRAAESCVRHCGSTALQRWNTCTLAGAARPNAVCTYQRLEVKAIQLRSTSARLPESQLQPGALAVVDASEIWMCVNDPIQGQSAGEQARASTVTHTRSLASSMVVEDLSCAGVHLCPPGCNCAVVHPHAGAQQ